MSLCLDLAQKLQFLYFSSFAVTFSYHFELNSDKSTHFFIVFFIIHKHFDFFFFRLIKVLVLSQGILYKVETSISPHFSILRIIFLIRIIADKRRVEFVNDIL